MTKKKRGFKLSENMIIFGVLALIIASAIGVFFYGSNQGWFKYKETITLPSEQPTNDFDNDGLPDNIDTDDDNDGFSDNEERRLGTDPKDASDYPVEEESPPETNPCENQCGGGISGREVESIGECTADEDAVAIGGLICCCEKSLPTYQDCSNFAIASGFEKKYFNVDWVGGSIDYCNNYVNCVFPPIIKWESSLGCCMWYCEDITTTPICTGMVVMDYYLAGTSTLTECQNTANAHCEYLGSSVDDISRNAVDGCCGWKCD